MEHKIGEIITLLDGRKAEVAEGSFCDGCIFAPENKEWECLTIAGNCGNPNRTDGRDVIYKELQ